MLQTMCNNLLILYNQLSVIENSGIKNQRMINFTDPARNDIPYHLTVPKYNVQSDQVYYQIHLYDTLRSQLFTTQLRFKQLKKCHELIKRSLSDSLDSSIKTILFPKTHFLTRTNSNPQLIEDRRNLLQKYFNTVINDPNIRGTAGVKQFLATCRKGCLSRRVRKLSVNQTKSGSFKLQEVKHLRSMSNGVKRMNDNISPAKIRNILSSWQFKNKKMK